MVGAMELLVDVGSLIKAVNACADWFIAYIREQDKFKKRFYESVYLSKQAKVRRLARRCYDKYK